MSGARRPKRRSGPSAEAVWPVAAHDPELFAAAHGLLDPAIRVYDHQCVDRCIDKLIAAADGGEADLDQHQAHGVTVSRLAEVGPAWRKSPGAEGDDYGPIERGDALLCVPDGCDWAAPGPRALLLHGGVNIYYSPEHGYLPLASRLARALGWPVLCPDFRLAPDHKFPSALDDCIGALRWLSAQPGTSQVVLYGDSSGGGLVMAVAAAVAADDSLPRVAAAAIVSGWLDQACASSSYETKQWDADTRKGDFIFTASEDGLSCTGAASSRAETCQMAKMYLGDASPVDPRASPVYAEELTGCCPVLLQCGTEEVTLGDSTRMAERLMEDGVTVALEIWPRMWHDWVMYAEGCGGEPLREAEVAIERAAAFLIRMAAASRL